MKIIPLQDRVIVKKDAAQEKTAGGIFIPNATNKDTMMGTVIAAGPGKHTKDGFYPTTVKVGDRVCFSKFSGADVTIDGIDYVAFQECDIFYIVEED